VCDAGEIRGIILLPWTNRVKSGGGMGIRREARTEHHFQKVGRGRYWGGAYNPRAVKKEKQRKTRLPGAD